MHDGAAEGELVGAGKAGGSVLRGGSDKKRKLSVAKRGLAEGGLPVGGLVLPWGLLEVVLGHRW